MLATCLGLSTYLKALSTSTMGLDFTCCARFTQVTPGQEFELPVGVGCLGNTVVCFLRTLESRFDRINLKVPEPTVFLNYPSFLLKLLALGHVLM